MRDSGGTGSAGSVGECRARTERAAAPQRCDRRGIVMQCSEMRADAASDAPRERPLASFAGLAAIVAVVYGAQLAWQHHVEATRGRELAALVAPGDLHMIASDTCPYCVVARRRLDAHQVAFGECSIERDPACRAEYERLGSPGTPAFVVKGRHLVLGLDEQRLRQALQQGR